MLSLQLKFVLYRELISVGTFPIKLGYLSVVVGDLTKYVTPFTISSVEVKKEQPHTEVRINVLQVYPSYKFLYTIYFLLLHASTCLYKMYLFKALHVS